MVVMAATMMQVLDSTIANVALPHMQASLGATPDTISWVLTSYIIAAAVATPMTGWLESRVGRRALILISVTGFTLASMLCGISASLGMMVGARLLQGLAGAFIGPLSQAIMLDIYPVEQRARALTIWGMGIMVGPILGPIVGGILTESHNWRWVFFINAPFGIAAFVGLLILLPKVKIKAAPFDMMGFAMIAIALCSLQLVLDRGTQLDWFESPEIMIEAGLCIAMLWMFAVHTASARAPLLPIELFRDRNFVIANLFLLVIIGIMMSSAALLPPMMQSLLGYNTVDAGLLIVPRGVAIMATMMISGRLMGKVDARIIILTGMVLVNVAQWLMTGFSLGMDRQPMIVTGLIQGFGFGLVMVPLNMIAFSTLSPTVRTSAAALYNLSRNIGGAVAISMFTAVLAHNLQVSHSDLAAHFSAIRFPFVEGGLLESMGMESGTALKMVDVEINRQAMMIAYLDDFWLMAVMTLSTLPLILFLNPMKEGDDSEMPVVME